MSQITLEMVILRIPFGQATRQGLHMDLEARRRMIAALMIR